MGRGVKVRHHLPVLELGQASQNAQRSGHLTVLRATQLQVLAKCPRNFWETSLNPNRRESRSKAANVGTLCHEVIEALMRRRFDLDTPRQRELDAALGRANVAAKERALLWQYCYRLLPDRPQVLAVEHEFVVMVVPGALPLCGHIDLLLSESNGTVTIVDHKTNRRPQAREWWAKQLQPLAYAYAVRKLWPGLRVNFRIGYVLQARDVAWATTPEDDQWFESQYERLYQELNQAQRNKYWKAKANEHCRWCPVVDNCQTATQRDQQFLASLNLGKR